MKYRKRVQSWVVAATGGMEAQHHHAQPWACPRPCTPESETRSCRITQWCVWDNSSVCELVWDLFHPTGCIDFLTFFLYYFFFLPSSFSKLYLIRTLGNLGFGVPAPLCPCPEAAKGLQRDLPCTGDLLSWRHRVKDKRQSFRHG